MSGLDVLILMKSLATAKSRLAPGVADATRRAAALLMLRRVLDAAGRAVGPAACQVVGGDDTVRSVALAAGCRWTPEPGHDLNSSLGLAMVRCYEEGAQAVLFLPADLPEISPQDVAAVVAASRELTRPVGVAARSDGGTNALLLPAGCAFPPELGKASFARHQALALAQGARLETPVAPGLGFDVDTPADLEWARAHVPGFAAELVKEEQWLGPVSSAREGG